MSLSPSLILLPNDVRADAVAIYAPDGTQLSGFDASRPANAAISTVPMTTSSAVVLAANAARRQVYITNTSSKILFIAFAATATILLYTLPIAGNQTVKLDLDGYTGVISGILTSGTGNAIVTEVTT